MSTSSEFRALYPGALAILPDESKAKVSKVTHNSFKVKGKTYSLKTGIAVGDRRKEPDKVIGLQITYKKHHIKVYRTESIGGWDNVYYYIMRVRDGYMPVDSFSSGEENLSTEVEALKKIVDENTLGRRHWKDYD